MSQTSSDEQLRGNTTRRPWFVLSDPFDLQDEQSETERMTVDVAKVDAEFLERFAAYRNALAAAQEKRLRRQWSRKTMAESFLSVQSAGVREQMRDMLKELGELPPADDKAALAAYVKRVLAWTKQANR